MAGISGFKTASTPAASGSCGCWMSRWKAAGVLLNATAICRPILASRTGFRILFLRYRLAVLIFDFKLLRSILVPSDHFSMPLASAK